jgi:hypothetical protein
VGIEPSSPLQTHKLFIPRSDKNYKNDGNVEVLANPSVNGGDRTDADPGEFDKPCYRCCFWV